MNCPNCKKEAPSVREICPECNHPIKPIPVPPGGKIRFGGYDWYVLDKQGDKTLVITEKVIGKRAYHGQNGEFIWETCDLRKYLNNEFFNSFSSADRSRIVEVVNENNDNPWYGANGGNPTIDRIFLLSIEEVVKYFGDSGQLKTKNRNLGSDWCKDEFYFFLSDQYDINRRAVDESGKVEEWRLRSTGANEGYAAYIYGDRRGEDNFDHGDICICGDGRSDDSKEWDGHMYFEKGFGELTVEIGVRPALWLSDE